MRAITLKPISAHNVRALRKELNQNQSTFWTRFGVTQSFGSRIEGGHPMPQPLALLLGLYLDGKIDEDDLVEASRRTPVLLGMYARAQTTLQRDD